MLILGLVSMAAVAEAVEGDGDYNDATGDDFLHPVDIAMMTARPAHTS